MKLSFNHFNHWLQKYDIVSTHSLCESGRKESEDWGCSSTNIVRQNIQHLSIVVWPPVAANNEVTGKCLLKFFSQERRWDSRALVVAMAGNFGIPPQLHWILHAWTTGNRTLFDSFLRLHQGFRLNMRKPQHHCSSREKIAVCLEKDQRAVWL